MSEIVPDSIYECDELLFNDGVYVVNWGAVWDIIKSRHWTASIQDLMRAVDSRTAVEKVFDDLPILNYEVDYNKVMLRTNADTILDYHKLRDVAYKVSSVQSIVNYFVAQLNQQRAFRKQTRQRKQLLQKKTVESINKAVSSAELKLSIAKFTANSSADILIIVSPITGNVSGVLAAGVLKGSVEYSETNSLKKAVAKGVLTSAVSAVPFLTKVKKAGFIVKLGVSSGTGAIGEGIYAVVSGGDVKKAIQSGATKGAFFGATRSGLGKALEKAVSPGLIIATAGGASVGHTAILDSNEEKKPQPFLDHSKRITDNCLTEAMIHGGCNIGFEPFVRENAIVKVS